MLTICFTATESWVVNLNIYPHLSLLKNIDYLNIIKSTMSNSKEKNQMNQWNITILDGNIFRILDLGSCQCSSGGAAASRGCVHANGVSYLYSKGAKLFWVKLKSQISKNPAGYKLVEIALSLRTAEQQDEPHLSSGIVSGFNYKLPPNICIHVFYAASIVPQSLHAKTLYFIIRSTTQIIVFLFYGCRLRMQGFWSLRQTLIKGN